MDIYNKGLEWWRKFWNVLRKIFSKKDQTEFKIEKVFKNMWCAICQIKKFW